MVRPSLLLFSLILPIHLLSLSRATNGNTGAIMAEQERRLASISTKLTQLDTLAPELGLMSVKMGNIESLLKQILDALQRGERAQATQKRQGAGARKGE